MFRTELNNDDAVVNKPISNCASIAFTNPVEMFIQMLRHRIGRDAEFLGYLVTLDPTLTEDSFDLIFHRLNLLQICVLRERKDQDVSNIGKGKTASETPCKMIGGIFPLSPS